MMFKKIYRCTIAKINISLIIFLFKAYLRTDLPSHPPDPVIEVMADDAELPYLRGIAHMCTYAGAVIVIAYADDAQGFRRIFREFAQVHYRCGLFPAHILYGHRQSRCDDLIDLVLDCLYLVVSRAFGKQIVTLALLPLDVGIPAARASEHVHHRAVQDMLRRVGGLIFSLVVAVEYRLFHIKGNLRSVRHPCGRSG